jgi:hypothetical protein
MSRTQNQSTKRLDEFAAYVAKAFVTMVEMTNVKSEDVPAPIQAETAQPDEVHVKSSPQVPERRGKPASKAEVLASVKAARDVIGQQNRPVQMGPLFQDIVARGFVISTPKPVSTFAARVRDYRKVVGLTYLDGCGWWLAERPYPPANYAPPNVFRIGKHFVQ